MCLIISALLSDAQADLICKLALAQITIEPIEFIVPNRSFWLRSRSFRLRSNLLGICERGQGCACSLLSDDSSWDRPSWLLRSDIREPLALSVRRLHENLSGGFDFQALWIGERHSDSISISINDLCNLITADEMGTKALYHVQ